MIKIVSISPHAERGRAYLWRLRPDLAHRLQRSEDHRLTEMSVVKALLGLRNARRQVGRDQRCQRAAGRRCCGTGESCRKVTLTEMVTSAQ